MTQVAQPQHRVQDSPPQTPDTQASAQDEHLRLQATERELLREFGPVVGEDRVRADLRDIVHRYDDAPVRTFLAVLVEREARARLRRASATS